MEIYVSQQLQGFLRSILLGVSLGLWYDLLRPFRTRFPRLGWLADLCFALSSFWGLFYFSMAFGEGQLRGYMVIGAFGGCVLFFCLLSRPLRPLWSFWWGCLEGSAALLVLPVGIIWKILRRFFTKNLFSFSLFWVILRKNIFGLRKKEAPHETGTSKTKRRRSHGRLAAPHCTVRGGDPAGQNGRKAGDSTPAGADAPGGAE